ncbi:MAG: amidohydrolase [Vicinamibacteria bacterium]
MRPLASLFLLALLMACLPTGPPADLVIRGGKIITLSQERPVAEALAVSGGRIASLGTTAEINSFVGPETRVIELDGGLAVPGFIDAHVHLMNLGLSMMQLDLVGTRSSREIVQKVKAASDTMGGVPDPSQEPPQPLEDDATLEPGTQPTQIAWVLGRGWDQNDWQENDFPTAAMIDRAVADRPVYLTRIDGHAGWANSKAMELAGIDKETPDPAGGEILRDEEGGPTGIFIDRANDLIADIIPPPTDAQLQTAFELAQDACLRAGITSLHDASVGAREVEFYREALTRQALRLRLYLMLDGSDARLLSQFFSHKPEISPWLTIRSVKLFADGALGSRGAALLEDYADRPEWRGLTLLTEDDVYEIADRALFAGYQVNVHAIGDAANRAVLNAFERAFDEHTGVSDPRFRIEHAQVLDELDIPRFGALGVIASMQGVQCTSDMPWVVDRIGEERAAEGAYVWQKLLLSGAKIANGTDAPVEKISPLENFYASITRQDQQGQPREGWFADQRMDREQALRSYTLDAAYAAFEEQVKGSLEVGKWADVAVLSKDILTIEPRQILDTEVLYTVVGGEVVYEKLEDTDSNSN